MNLGRENLSLSIIHTKAKDIKQSISATEFIKAVIVFHL